MRKLLFLFLALVLCGCSAVPALREGYYLLPLAESEGVPFYFRLEEDGSGYLHAMGQDSPVTWEETGLGDLFCDCVPTRTGMEFPDGDGTLSLQYSRTLPEEYAGIVLRPGFYVPEDETLESLLTYAQLRADGTAIFSIMGMEKEIEWTPEVFYFGDMIICATADGFIARDTVTVHYRYTGDTLPEHYNEGVLP